ncbi:MAG: flagellar basal body P-ring protein FlgI [Pyrinomonadaceae bacterium]
MSFFHTFTKRTTLLATVIVALLPIAALCQTPDDPMSIRVKDLAEIEGVRSNQLIGYGLVIGLNKTGDRVQQNQFSRQSVQNLLERMGISVDANSLKPENVAAVMVTATLPPFVRQGMQLDVTVSSIADAKSLQGGTLILTELKAVNGQVFAVAQGSVSIGGISAGRGGSSVEINHPTVGRVPNGATVERGVPTELAPNNKLTLVLRNDDFSTAARLYGVINAHFGQGTAKALDSRNVEVSIPTGFKDNTVQFIAELESLRLTPDKIAKIVINERTGTIIMGREVRIGAVAISQGGVTVRIGTTYDVVQPEAFSKNGTTAVVPQTTVEVEQKPAESFLLPEGSTVDEVVRGLRAMGVSARDTISILQAIKSAGAMNAELEMQ